MIQRLCLLIRGALLFALATAAFADCGLKGLWATPVAYYPGTLMMGSSGASSVGGGSGVHYLRVHADCSYEYQFMGVSMGSKVGSITSYQDEGKITEISPALWLVERKSCWANGSDMACGKEEITIQQESRTVMLAGQRFTPVPVENQVAISEAMANGKGAGKSMKIFFWVALIGVLVLSFVATQD